MVKVTFKGKTKDGKPLEKTFVDTDNFGISNTGDLILVKLMTVPQPPGVPPQQRGSNIHAFAAGSWLTAKVEHSKIQTPPGVIMTPGQA